MTPSQQLARARACVQICFAEQQNGEKQTTEEDASDFLESILIHNEFYRGRRFRSKTLTAVWFAEEDQLKIHSIDGEVLACFDSEEMAELVSEERVDVLPMRPVEQPQPERRAA